MDAPPEVENAFHTNVLVSCESLFRGHQIPPPILLLFLIVAVVLFALGVSSAFGLLSESIAHLMSMSQFPTMLHSLLPLFPAFIALFFVAFFAILIHSAYLHYHTLLTFVHKAKADLADLQRQRSSAVAALDTLWDGLCATRAQCKASISAAMTELSEAQTQRDNALSACTSLVTQLTATRKELHDALAARQAALLDLALVRNERNDAVVAHQAALNNLAQLQRERGDSRAVRETADFANVSASHAQRDCNLMENHVSSARIDHGVICPAQRDPAFSDSRGIPALNHPQGTEEGRSCVAAQTHDAIPLSESQGSGSVRTRRLAALAGLATGMAKLAIWKKNAAQAAAARAAELARAYEAKIRITQQRESAIVSAIKVIEVQARASMATVMGSQAKEQAALQAAEQAKANEKAALEKLATHLLQCSTANTSYASGSADLAPGPESADRVVELERQLSEAQERAKEAMDKYEALKLEHDTATETTGSTIATDAANTVRAQAYTKQLADLQLRLDAFQKQAASAKAKAQENEALLSELRAVLKNSPMFCLPCGNSTCAKIPHLLDRLSFSCERLASLIDYAETKGLDVSCLALVPRRRLLPPGPSVQPLPSVSPPPPFAPPAPMPSGSSAPDMSACSDWKRQFQEQARINTYEYPHHHPQPQAVHSSPSKVPPHQWQVARGPFGPQY